MSWFPDSIIDRPPRSDEFGLIVRPIFSGSDPNVLTVQLASGSISLSGSFSADPTRPATAVLTSASYTLSSYTIAASNSTRRMLTVYNDSSRAFFLKLGPLATLTDFSVRVPARAYFELPQPAYTGDVTIVWAVSASGYARATELTP